MESLWCQCVAVAEIMWYRFVAREVPWNRLELVWCRFVAREVSWSRVELVWCSYGDSVVPLCYQSGAVVLPLWRRECAVVVEPCDTSA